MNKTDSTDNPLLDFSGFTRFDEIRPHHVEPAIDELLARSRARINQLVDDEAPPTWESFILPIEELDDQLNRAWSPVSHLNSVMNNKALQQAHQACLPKISDYAAELGQNKGLFRKIGLIEENMARQPDEKKGKTYAERYKSILNDLRDFRLSGIDLAPQEQPRYKEIVGELSRLSNQFSQNLQDATDGWSMHLSDEADLAGLPDNAISLARDVAQNAGLDGWVFNLQYPSYQPFMTYANSGKLREKMYRAFVTRASEIGSHEDTLDNTPIMEEILRLKAEKSQMLGFEHYAQYSLETKMARDVEEVERFLLDLSERSKPCAIAEVAELSAFANKNYGVDELNPWDYAWFSEKVRQEKYDFSQEMLRPFFPLPRVLDGMFSIVNKLFGIRVEQVAAPQLWHPDVMFFKVADEKGEARGFFYVDLFARESKRGGAWMDDAVGRRRTGEQIQLPVAFLTCNFSTPIGDEPSLLTHDEVITLFHEFGHGLHHLLTKIEVPGIAGINGVPWDAVELPSQFLENWCWDRESLDLISGHVETGEPIPDELLAKVHQARNFQSAMQMQRQIEFSLFDLRLHMETKQLDKNHIQKILDQVREEVAVIEVPEFNRFQHGFGHIFAGGYDAGYYSYKWAEVLSADAFSLFEENGIFDRETGERFKTNILEKGGSEEPAKLFANFRGRNPSVSALLRHSGLKESNDPVSNQTTA